MLFGHGSAPKLQLYFLQCFALPLVNSLAQRIRKKSLTTAVFAAEHHSGVTVAPFAAFRIIGKVQADQLNCSLPRKEKHKRPSSVPPSPPSQTGPSRCFSRGFGSARPPPPPRSRRCNEPGPGPPPCAPLATADEVTKNP